MKKTKTQHAYDTTFRVLADLIGQDNVYVKTPVQDVQYPFATVNVNSTQPTFTKSQNMERIVIDVHLWGNIKQRWELVTMALQLKNLLSEQLNLTNETNETQLEDDTTNELLFHDHLKLVFYY